ncbi:MAG TPA: restriction endonuclease subunit S [Acidimicrobiales bacterium]|nr:restriction endonuclease subunit S [Acidimicrobiales bacterium]
MNEWVTAQLGDVVDYFDSKRVPLSGIERATRQGQYPYYGASGVIDWIDDYIFDGRYLLVAEDGENLNSRKLPVAFFADGRFWVNNHAHIIRGKPHLLDDVFLQHWFAHADISGYITGAAQPKLSQANMRRMTIPLPPLPTQRKIGAVLSAYDDLIENNNRRIKLLEEMAQRIYREWFVDFRYPGHQSVPLVTTELGPTPDSWEVRQLSEVADVVRGRSYRSDDLVESGGVPFVNLKCLRRGGGFRFDGLKRYQGKHDTEQEVREGDIVLGVTDLTQEREILARATLVPCINEKFGVISLDVVKIAPHAAEDRLALFFTLSCSDFAQRVREYANGSTVLHLSPTHVAENKLLWPPGALRARFVQNVEPMITAVNNLAEECKVLSSTRGLLLPRLISGEIDVADLDIAMPEEAA